VIRKTWPLLVVLALAAGCGPAAPSVAPALAAASPAVAEQVGLEVTPTDGSRGVPAAAEVGWTVRGGRVTSGPR
jgi:hypothetical protein